jgi:DNA polymerase type B, organellar and viral
LLANRLGEEIYNENGLSSEECLNFLTRRYPASYIRIFYGFGYDVNMILKDLPPEYWDHISRGIRWLGHRIQYLPGKMLRVDGYTYYDILPFFARGLVAALKDVLHETDPVIEKGKSLRADLFESLSPDEIREYNMHELIMTEKLAEHLREALNNIELPLGAWYGPGAIAKKMFQVHAIEKQIGDEAPPDCYFALENAYYGGRFENQILGKVPEVWEYDIHSAYPSVIAGLPYFRNFRHVGKYQPDSKFSLWKVRWDLRNSKTNRLLQPLPFRSRDGRLSFPLVGEGWYWQPELAASLRIYGQDYFQITEGWIAETEGTPFDWVEKLYYQRMELKDAGDASEYAIKVGINSLYGKTAQRVGSTPYFNVGWAGYITSATRAKLLEAYSLDPEGCIGFATDAIYSRRQLRGIQISERLGDWEEKHYPNGGIFILPGLYILSDGKVQKNRIRGLPNSDALAGLLDGLAERPYDIPKTSIRRFISNRLANRAPNKYGQFRCKFIDVEYNLGIREPRKRYYDFPVDSNGIRYGAILNGPIDSKPVIWGVNRLHSREEGDYYLPTETLFDSRKYEFFLDYPHFDIPQSVSRQFADDDDDRGLALFEQEGEVIAELEPELIWDSIPIVEADTEFNNYNG